MVLPKKGFNYRNDAGRLYRGYLLLTLTNHGVIQSSAHPNQL